MRTYGFHPEASLELSEAFDHYLEIDNKLAESFVSEIEYSLLIARRSPERWRIVEGEVRRTLVHRFPYGIYYTFTSETVKIWAVMHLSRKPGYWKDRL